MKIPTLALSASLLALGLAACGTMSTIESRAKEMNSTFSTASGNQQSLMRRGLVAAGFTPSMAYISLGTPDTKSNPSEHTERWIYKNFDQMPGSPVMGAAKVNTLNPSSAATARAQNSLKNTYSTRSDASEDVDTTQRHLVLTFTDGKLSSMEMLTM